MQRAMAEKEMAKNDLEKKVQQLYETFSGIASEDQRQEVDEIFQKIVNNSQ